METKKDYSYGVIPVIKIDGSWQIFILNQISYRSKDDIYWTFPKGHPEGDETPKEAALRELEEESGIVLDYLEEDKTFKQGYTFLHKNIKIKKEVCYYLGYAKNKNFVIQPEEIKEGRWCSFDEAREILTHHIAKILLDEVCEHLRSTGR